MRVVLGVNLALALVSAGRGCGWRGSEREGCCGDLGAVRGTGEGLDAQLCEGLGHRSAVRLRGRVRVGGRNGVGLRCGDRVRVGQGDALRLGDGLNSGRCDGLGNDGILDGSLRRGAECRDLGGCRNGRSVNRFVIRRGGGHRGSGNRRVGDDLVERRQFLLVAGAFGRGSHRVLRLVGCVSRHYRSWVGGRRGRRCQDVHHSARNVQAREQWAHHCSGFAGCREA